MCSRVGYKKVVCRYTRAGDVKAYQNGSYKSKCSTFLHIFLHCEIFFTGILKLTWLLLLKSFLLYFQVLR